MQFYRHYKGNTYKLVCFAIDAETQKQVVVYKGADGQIWSRPKEVFFGKVQTDKGEIERFVKL